MAIFTIFWSMFNIQYSMCIWYLQNVCICRLRTWTYTCTQHVWTYSFVYIFSSSIWISALCPLMNGDMNGWSWIMSEPWASRWAEFPPAESRNECGLVWMSWHSGNETVSHLGVQLAGVIEMSRDVGAGRGGGVFPIQIKRGQRASASFRWPQMMLQGTL